MPRAIWSGSIAFGLVNAPVKMYSAIDEHDLELHLVHEKDGSRIGYEKICKTEGKPVPADEIVKALEVDDGELVYLTDEDFEAAGEKTYRAIEVLDFVPHEEIDPIVFQRSYYLGPADGAEKVYALLVRAMEDSGLSGIVRYVFHDRQQLGCLRVRDGVIVPREHVLRGRDPSLEGHRPEGPTRLQAGARDGRDAHRPNHHELLDHEKYRDEYTERLLEIVKRKRKGEEVHAAAPSEEEEAPSDLLDALRASVDAAKSRSKPKSRSKSRNGRSRSKPSRRPPSRSRS